MQRYVYIGCLCGWLVLCFLHVTKVAFWVQPAAWVLLLWLVIVAKQVFVLAWYLWDNLHCYWVLCFHYLLVLVTVTSLSPTLSNWSYILVIWVLRYPPPKYFLLKCLNKCIRRVLIAIHSGKWSLNVSLLVIVFILWRQYVLEYFVTQVMF